MLVGHAHASKDHAGGPVLVRLKVGDVLDKTVEVHGDRAWTPDGRLLEETRSTQVPLLWERAAGGTATVDNIELRCRAHNALEAELFFAASRVGEAPAPYEYRVTRDTLYLASQGYARVSP